MASPEFKGDLLPEETLEIICQNIYLSCDTEGTNEVPTLKLIEFVKPYLEKHPSALKSLQAEMDPQGANIGIPYQTFLEKMSMWMEKILDSHETNETQTPRNFEENLLFAQSTPKRRPRGDSKFLNIMDSISSEEDLLDKEETKYPSESLSDRIGIIERVTYQKNKVLSENELLKNQVAAAEEQVEKLTAELDTYRMRLINEQNLNELLKKGHIDETKEEINKSEQQMETYIKKLQDCERDNLYINNLNKQLESENTELIRNCDTLEAEKKALQVEIEELNTIIQNKDVELSHMMKQKSDLEEDLKLKIFLNKDLEDENEFLDHQKVSLEKRLSFNARPMSPIPNISQRDGICIPLYSINKQQKKFAQLRCSFPISMINNGGDGGEKLNCSLPTKLNQSVDAFCDCYRFPVASGRDLHESFMVSTSLTDEQSSKLKGYPQVSLQEELLEARGSVFEECQENKLLVALREELRRVKQARQELEEEYEAYRKEVADNNRPHVDVVEEMEKLKQVCNTYKETIHNISKSNSELENTVKQSTVRFENKISNMENEIEHKSKRIELLKNKLKIRIRFINVIRSDLQKRKLLIKELNHQNEQLSKKYKEELESRDKLVRELQMKQQYIIELSHDLQVTKQQSNTSVNANEAQLKEALNENARQKKLIEDQIKSIQNYESIITNQVEQLALRTEELNVVKKSYEEKTTSLAKRLDKTTQELNIIKQKYEKVIVQQTMTLAGCKEKLNVLTLNYEKTIASQTRQIAERTNELVEAKRRLNTSKQEYEMLNASQAMELKETKKKFSAPKQNYEENITRHEVMIRDDNMTRSDVHPVNVSRKEGYDPQEDNKYRWITHTTIITIFVLFFLYWHYQWNDFDQGCVFNFVQKVHVGRPPI